MDVGTSTCSRRTARKRKNRQEGESEVVGRIVLGTQRTSEETWKNRRRGRDVVREREGARGIRNEI